MIGIYIQGLKTTFHNKRIVFLIYIFNLIFGLMIAIPFASTLSSALGSFGSVSALIEGFNFTFFADFMRIYGKGLGALFSVAKWMIPIYMLLQVFLNGGMISTFLDKAQQTVQVFFENSVTYFWKYFFVFLIFFVQHVIGVLLIVIPVSIVFSDGLEGVSSEAAYWTAAYWSVGIYVLIFMLISAASDYTKIVIATGETTFWRSIGRGWKTVFTNLLNTLGIHILNLALGFFLLWISWNMSDVLGTSSKFIVLITIVLQQLISMARMYLRMTYYASLVSIKTTYTGKRKSTPHKWKRALITNLT